MDADGAGAGAATVVGGFALASCLLLLEEAGPVEAVLSGPFPPNDLKKPPMNLFVADDDEEADV